jgi:hypothetical protein
MAKMPQLRSPRFFRQTRQIDRFCRLMLTSTDENEDVLCSLTGVSIGHRAKDLLRAVLTQPGPSPAPKSLGLVSRHLPNPFRFLSATACALTSSGNAR